MKVGLLVIATNKYTSFLQPLISSADNYFLKDQEVTYFVFTNKDLNLQSNRDIINTKVEHKPWPWMTFGRYEIFDNNADLFKNMDYLYYCDADMRFVGDVGTEILGDTVGTFHPGFLGRRGTPEVRWNSTACVHAHESMRYYAGGFNGGSRRGYLDMANTLAKNIRADEENGITAVWHDESHLNRYFCTKPPIVKLDPGYCYPESWDLPFEKRLLALDKDHQEIRS